MLGPDEARCGVTTVELLRRFDVRRDHQSFMVPPASQRLLAFLALQAGATTRVYVAGMLWTDFSPDKANANLRTTLWRLSRAPWPLVDATPTHLRLAHGVTVDVHETEAIARRITSDGYRCEDDELERIVAAGDLLPDWYDDWTIIERERFRQTRLHALEVLSYTLTREGRHRQAIEVGLAAVAGEPLRESAHRAVMRAHLAEGNRCEALRQYELFRRLLAEELGVGPSPEMEMLHHRCVRGDAVVTPLR